MKVYVVNYILVLDGVYQAEESQAFSTEDGARELFNELVNEDRVTSKAACWTIDDSNDNYYESWSEDGYAMNHCHVALKECEVN